MAGITQHKLFNLKYLLAGIAIILGLTLVYRHFSPSLGEVFTSKEDIAEKKKILGKYQSKLDEKQALLKQLVLVENRLEQNEKYLLTGKTVALTAVEIQKMLIDITRKNNVDINSIRILAAREIEKMPYQAVPVQITVSSKIRQIVNVMHSINNSAHLLYTSDFNIRASGIPTEEKITASLTIEGLMRADAPVEE